MRAVAVGRNAEIHERIGLRADRLRHLLKFNPVVAQFRLALHLHLQLCAKRPESLPAGRAAKNPGRGAVRYSRINPGPASKAEPPNARASRRVAG